MHVLPKVEVDGFKETIACHNARKSVLYVWPLATSILN